MAMPGSSGPKPFRQVRTSTIFLRVPTVDWQSVKRGRKTEFRSGVGRNITQLWQVQTPTPVVGYCQSRTRGYESALLLLEATWREPLGAITPESLQREGFESFAHFRRYFMQRERRHFTPTREVQAYRVRPWQPSDFTPMADALLTRLYGDFLPSSDAAVRSS